MADYNAVFNEMVVPVESQLGYYYKEGWIVYEFSIETVLVAYFPSLLFHAFKE